MRRTILLRHPLILGINAALILVAPHLALADVNAITSTTRDVLLPNTGAWSSAGINVGGTTFRNLGLQGVGRVAASALDAATGESLGSISDMQITNFTNNNNGTFSGTFHFLPDRGFNSGTTFSNYAARINAFDFTFTPHTSAATNSAQNQIAMSFKGSTRFTYDHDNTAGTAPIFSTGLLATGTGALFGTTVPTSLGSTTQSDGSFSNRLTIDAEGLAFDTRPGKAGSGWLSDEYGASIYHFNSSQQIDGQLALPAALIPHSPGGTTNFAADPPISGRRANQGLEGLALSPDGTKLFGLLQSATIQDSAAGNVGRSNARLVVYDVTGTDVPSDPTQQYVIQLPRVDDNGGTPAVNRTAAQSAIVALNDHQLLILSRDGNGRGGAAVSPVFKSILLADLNGATNFDGTFDAEGQGPAPGGSLSSSVTPIEWKEALNLLGKLDLSITELAQFGLNLNAGPGDINTLSEKWEGLSLAPINDGTGDFFLFVGNDNDFLSASGKYLDQNGVLQNTSAAGVNLENDTVVLAFRVSAVPIPAAGWLLGSALLGVAQLRRRRAA